MPRKHTPEVAEAAEPFDIEWTPGELLRKARTTAGIKPDEMADAIGVSVKTIGNWEHDRNEKAPNNLVAEKYARKAGWPEEAFVALFKQAVRRMRWLNDCSESLEKVA